MPKNFKYKVKTARRPKIMKRHCERSEAISGSSCRNQPFIWMFSINAIYTLFAL